MQIISPMKKTLRKVFAAPHFDAGWQSAAIPIRHMKFDFEPHRLDHRFYMNAELAEYMMKHEQVFFTSQDEKQRAIWMWHMLEESEHKDIDYDVFQSLSNNYALRIAGFFPALITILVLISAASLLVPICRRPENLISWRYWKDMLRSVRLLFGLQDGVYGNSWRHIFDYLRPGFHLNDYDTSEFLAYYKARLLNPETGVLAPYFVKEFTPVFKA